jgi:hypothetical protein
LLLSFFGYFPFFFSFFSVEMSHDCFCFVSLLFHFLWLLTVAGLQLYYLVFSFIFVYFSVLLIVALVPWFFQFLPTVASHEPILMWLLSYFHFLVRQPKYHNTAWSKKRKEKRNKTRQEESCDISTEKKLQKKGKESNKDKNKTRTSSTERERTEIVVKERDAAWKIVKVTAKIYIYKARVLLLGGC